MYGLANASTVRRSTVSRSQESCASVVDRIVEKNEAFFRLISDGTLSHAEKLALLDKAIPQKAVP